MSICFDSQQWALILGGSSGFGLATAKKVARHGMSVAVVHRDRRGAMKGIEPGFDEIRACAGDFVAFNLDALSDEGRDTVMGDLSERLVSGGRIRMLMHSIAFGNLRLLAPLDPGHGDAGARAREKLAERLGVGAEQLTEALQSVFENGDETQAGALGPLAPPPSYDTSVRLEDEDFARTVYSMGTSLSTWVQTVFDAGLFADDARVLSMTSEGNEVALRGYAAVAAAKCALESVSRAIAVEYAPYGIRANVVQAGVTDSAALRLIPGSAHMKAAAALRNPFGRLTTAEEVADFICLLCTDEARWVNGTVLRVDGGERISG
ncbi:MAG TPA: SDR family oxidoreductase [Candidatus Latescibacteria bacterium]|nr:SDR family oxidoreductase [Candidatus Latescibacterota bacterium]